MLADATHDLGREQGLSCRRNASKALPGSSNAPPGPRRCCPSGCTRKRFRGVSSEGDSLVEDTPFRAALRIALSDRNGGSAEFFNSLLGAILEIKRRFISKTRPTVRRRNIWIGSSTGCVASRPHVPPPCSALSRPLAVWLSSLKTLPDLFFRRHPHVVHWASYAATVALFLWLVAQFYIPGKGFTSL